MSRVPKALCRDGQARSLSLRTKPTLGKDLFEPQEVRLKKVVGEYRDTENRCEYRDNVNRGCKQWAVR